jgi:hypothetical protein
MTAASSCASSERGKVSRLRHPGLEILDGRGVLNPITHQDPGFLDVVANKSPSVVRIYLPPDANCLLSVGDYCFLLARRGFKLL